VRALEVWNRRLARLPGQGVLLVATDLQGNRRDYERMKELYAAEQDAILAFCGDLVHGPSPDMNEPGAWPDYLGTEYRDESAALVRDFEQWTRRERGFSLLGNHEHAHIGGPVVPKFYEDEAAILDAALGDDRARIHEFFRAFPLLAVAPCGVVLTHAAPRATEDDPDAFEQLSYDGYEGVPIQSMYAQDTLGALLWSRSATPEEARALLDAVGGALVVYGHDVVHEGYEKVGDEQLCLSTSYGVDDAYKFYVRLDLAARYASVHDLREGVEIRKLYNE
jgi:hypothetical protein